MLLILFFSIFLFSIFLFSFFQQTPYQSKSERQCHLSMSITNEVVLWYLNGCVASLYSPQRDAVTGKRVPKDTVSFTNKAYLAYKQVNSLVQKKYLLTVKQQH